MSSTTGQKYSSGFLGHNLVAWQDGAEWRARIEGEKALEIHDLFGSLHEAQTDLHLRAHWHIEHKECDCKRGSGPVWNEG